MTHAVVWIDHKEARTFRVHPEAADESNTRFTAIRKAVGSRESTRMMRSISSTTSHGSSMAWTPSSSSDPPQRSMNSSSSCRRIIAALNPKSPASRQRIIRPGERSSPTQEDISRQATEWAVLR